MLGYWFLAPKRGPWFKRAFYQKPNKLPDLLFVFSIFPFYFFCWISNVSFSLDWWKGKRSRNCQATLWFDRTICCTNATRRSRWIQGWLQLYSIKLIHVGNMIVWWRNPMCPHYCLNSHSINFFFIFVFAFISCCNAMTNS